MSATHEVLNQSAPLDGSSVKFKAVNGGSGTFKMAGLLIRDTSPSEKWVKWSKW